MRIFLVLLSCFIAGCSIQNKVVNDKQGEQAIDSEMSPRSYYDFYKIITTHRVTTAFIRSSEAIPVIRDIMDENGLKLASNVEYTLPNGEQVVLDLYNAELDLGVLFKPDHYGSVKKEHRNINKNINTSYDNNSNLGFGGLFDNIIVLQETWYWYQYTEEDLDVDLLGKSDIMKILEQDVLFFIDQFRNK